MEMLKGGDTYKMTIKKNRLPFLVYSNNRNRWVCQSERDLLFKIETSSGMKGPDMESH